MKLLKYRLGKRYKTNNPVTQVSYKKKISKKLKELNYKSMGRDLITNQQMNLKWMQIQIKLQNKKNTYLIIPRNNYMRRYNNGIIYGKKRKDYLQDGMMKT